MARLAIKDKVLAVKETFTMEQVKACVTLDRVILFLLLLLLWALFTVPFILFYSQIQRTNSTSLANSTSLTVNATQENQTEDTLQRFNTTASAHETNETSCSQDFYFEESKNYCVPDCYSWTSYSQAESTAVDVVIIISCCVATISTITVLVISCIRRNTVLKFPSILVIYMSVSILLFYVAILIGYFHRYTLYCVSMNLLDNFTSATPYCILTGALIDYISLQLLVWWLSHVVSIFFLIFYPIQSKAFLNSRKIHLVHATVAAIGLLTPTIPIFATVLSGISDDNNPERFGYRIFLYPPMTCGNGRSTFHFYTVNLPSNIIITTGVTFLLFIFWKLYKRQRMMDTYQVSTAEKKILVSFGYFTILQISSSTLSVYFRNAFTDFAIDLFSFFFCARYSVDCLEPQLNDTYSAWLSVISWLVYACLPLFLLAYVIDFEKLGEYLQKKKGSLCLFTSKQP